MNRKFDAEYKEDYDSDSSIETYESIIEDMNHHKKHDDTSSEDCNKKHTKSIFMNS